MIANDLTVRRTISRGRMLVDALERQGDHPALHMGDVVLTARQFRDRLSVLDQAVRHLGINPLDSASVLSRNSPDLLVLMGVSMVLSLRNTPLAAMSSAEDHAYVVNDAEIDTIFFEPHFETHIRGVQELVGRPLRLVSLGPSEIGVDLFATAEQFEPGQIEVPEVDPEAHGGLSYTGGTTGFPKGIMHNAIGGSAMLQIQMAEWDWPENARVLVTTPLSHAGASLFLPTLLRGGCLYVVPSFDPASFFETVQRHRITVTMMVPTMIYALLDFPDFDSYDMSSLERIYYGAASISPVRLREAIQRIGPVFFQFYGQSECPMTMMVLRREDHDVDDLDRLATCGRPVPWVDLRLLDEDFQEVAVGEVGEICVRGPLVMAGYWKQPELTREVFAGGWLHTGDLARRDAEGFVTIVDRTKDMIISGGFNVYPREVEDALGMHPDVAAAAVVGKPDDRWGEAVTAFVVTRGNTVIDTEELFEIVRSLKGSVHVPKSVHFIDAIPTTALGKIDKKALRALASA